MKPMPQIKKLMSKLYPYLRFLKRSLLYLGILTMLVLPILFSLGQFKLAERIGNYLFYLLLIILIYQFINYFLPNKKS